MDPSTSQQQDEKMMKIIEKSLVSKYKEEPPRKKQRRETTPGMISLHVGNISVDTTFEQFDDFLSILEVSVHNPWLSEPSKKTNTRFGFVDVKTKEDYEKLQVIDTVLNGQTLKFSLRHAPPPKYSDLPLAEDQFSPSLVEEYGFEKVKEAFHREIKINTQVLMQLEKIPPAQEETGDMLCYKCGRDDHPTSDCRKRFQQRNDKDECDFWGVGSSTVRDQVKALTSRRCQIVLGDRKLYSLVCYLCDMKFANKDKYTVHLKKDHHGQLVAGDKIPKLIGHPARISVLTRLSKLPSVFSKDGNIKDKEDYHFLCSVCCDTVPGPVDKHLETKVHKHKLRYIPRCHTCNLYGRPHRFRQHKDIIINSLHAKMLELKENKQKTSSADV